MDPKDPFNTNMFVGQGANVSGLVQALEAQLPLMGDDDRDFVLGCQVALDIGGIITPANTQRLLKIAKNLNAAGHDILGGGVEPPLSLVNVLRDLANNIHTLLPHEKKFANEMARKIQTKEQPTPKEIERLLTIYNNKGF